MSDTVLSKTSQQGVTTLTLNRPERHNALNRELVKALLAELKHVGHELDIRAVIVAGNGDTFCSGADLSEMRSALAASEEQNRRDASELAQLMRTLYELPKPTVARVNGSAYGGGLGLIACCDFAIALDTARFAFTELRLGLVPAVISPYIVHALGAHQSKRLFLSAATLTAEQALKTGLLDQVVNDVLLDASVEQCVIELLKAGPRAVGECKSLIRSLTPVDSDTIRHTAELIAKLRVSPEAQEGMAAFFDKRNPDWRS